MEAWKNCSPRQLRVVVAQVEARSPRVVVAQVEAWKNCSPRQLQRVVVALVEEASMPCAQSYT